jgi:hypothetical protein
MLEEGRESRRLKKWRCSGMKGEPRLSNAQPLVLIGASYVTSSYAMDPCIFLSVPVVPASCASTTPPKNPLSPDS